MAKHRTSVAKSRSKSNQGVSKTTSPKTKPPDGTAAKLPPDGTTVKSVSGAPAGCIYTGLGLSALVPVFALIYLILYSSSPTQDTLLKPTAPVTPDATQVYPLHKEYNVDYAKVMAVREENMKQYTYNYSRTGVDRRSALSLQEFRDVYDGKWPVLITDIVSQWQAFNWTRDFLYNNYGKDRVTMKAVDVAWDETLSEVMSEFMLDMSQPHFGSHYAKNALSQAVSLALPLELFYKNTHKAYPSRWTYVEDELFIPMRPQLKKQIGKCKYLEEDFYKLFPPEVQPWDAMLLWGTKYSRSSLHMDPYNWTGTNAVLSGRKRWKLYPPGQDHLLYVIPGKKSGFPLDCYKYNSPIDAYEPDLLKYPEFSRAKTLDFVQEPGELLFIPTGWYHQAFNEEETIAISSQVMNRNNYRIVLEEIFQVDDGLRRRLPPHIDGMSLIDQVKTVMSLLSKSVLQRGKEVTSDIINQVNNAHKTKKGALENTPYADP